MDAIFIISMSKLRCHSFKSS